MTSFDAFETSREGSRPAELYEVVVGSAAPLRWTTTEDPITIGANVFLPEAGLSRGAVVRSREQRAWSMTLRVPATNAIAQLYINTPPAARVEIRGFRVQRLESPTFNTVLPIFIGQIYDVRFTQNGYLAEIEVRSIEQTLTRQMPRFTFSPLCNHFLYDSGCKVDPGPHNLIGVVTAQSDGSLTVAGVAASPHNFVGGFVRPTSGLDFRQVLAVSGDVLTLDAPFGVNLVGENANVFASCDHVIDGDCALVFDNVIEFGGFAFIPNRNPFEDGVD